MEDITFTFGKVVITPTAMNEIPQVEILTALKRHLSGDFGDLTDHDKEVNLEALEHGGQILSAYNSSDGLRFYIITDPDRSVTTILLCEEY